ncbi:MAG: ATP-binding cassette domain-containing protein, partial [Chloroflexi bacterium]|nr:ATP-binding cassette domain-containing protein [Chloroflexota bacterium]
HVPPKDRDIAMVFQNYALYPHMSVYDNMAFGLQLRGVPRTEIVRRVQEAADILGIQDLLKRKPRELSGGQRQRVALGRAIVREPKVFLMDEPLSNLDAKLRVQTRAELIKLHKRLGATVIYVTHDQVEAMTMGTRIAVMKDGLLQQVDTPQRIYEAPANMFVAEFIGSPAMNFVPGRVEAAPEGVVVQGAHLRLPLPAGTDRRWAPHVGQRVVAGIRPEHLSLVSAPQPAAATLVARIDVAETLGAEAILYLVIGETNLVARTPYSPELRAGRDVAIAVDPAKVHLFDGQTQEALAHGRAAA